jgi:hypothetical protein
VIADLENAADVIALPRAEGIVVDGILEPKEWSRSSISSDFYTYGVYAGSSYARNRKADAQTRVRMLSDENDLYCLVSFQGGEDATADRLTMYAASADADKPIAVIFDRISGQVSLETTGGVPIEAHENAEKTAIECRIPHERLRTKGKKTIRANFARTLINGSSKTESFWRGNTQSVRDPIVFGSFQIADKSSTEKSVTTAILRPQESAQVSTGATKKASAERSLWGCGK